MIGRADQRIQQRCGRYVEYYAVHHGQTDSCVGRQAGRQVDRQTGLSGVLGPVLDTDTDLATGHTSTQS